ncbi:MULTISPECIES: hypothetical protein [unclassified Virgibacillus]|uniref:hypothetical protein n=1 Tax=unclassified Virgibacillus TaxID=2620237 RepID=UPI000EF46D8E|nr:MULTISPECIES: hypothetical protein [unclassified Virgibacillus]MDY7043820.1 hypothetical protein [Virgibacillus sp. M23]
MFQINLFAELLTRIGSDAEIATDNNLIEGTLLKVTSQLVIVNDNSGYGPQEIYIAFNAINFVRFS